MGINLLLFVFLSISTSSSSLFQLRLSKHGGKYALCTFVVDCSELMILLIGGVALVRTYDHHAVLPLCLASPWVQCHPASVHSTERDFVYHVASPPSERSFCSESTGSQVPVSSRLRSHLFTHMDPMDMNINKMLSLFVPHLNSIALLFPFVPPQIHRLRYESRTGPLSCFATCEHQPLICV